MSEVANAAEARPGAFDPAHPMPQIAAVAPRSNDWSGVAIATVFLAIALGAFFSTRGMSAMGSVFPATIAAVLVVLSLALIALGVAGRGRSAPVKTESGPVSTPRRVFLVSIFGLWVFLIPVLGFAVTSLAAFIALALISEHEEVPVKTLAIRGVVAILTVAAFWWLMSEVLLLRMPSGLLI